MVRDFLLRWMMISATKVKIDMSIPTNKNPGGKRKCSILSGSTFSSSSSKAASVQSNPVWDIKMFPVCQFIVQKIANFNNTRTQKPLIYENENF